MVKVTLCGGQPLAHVRTQAIRLDTRLCNELGDRITPAPSRSRVKRVIKAGGVSVNGNCVTKPSTKLRASDVITWDDCVDTQCERSVIMPEPVPLDIHYEDDHVIVLDKPAGMIVHPAGSVRTGTLVNALLHHVGAGTLTQGTPLNGEAYDSSSLASTASELDAVAASLPDEQPICADESSATASVQPEAVRGLSSQRLSASEWAGGVVRPGIVHRLDKGTTGVMVVAKNEAAHAMLSRQFAPPHTIRRQYLAIVWGSPSPPAGQIATHIGRDPGNRLRMAVVQADRPGSRHAVSNYTVVATLDSGNCALVRFELETGRTHQIRVHARHMGHPLLGDGLYNGTSVRSGPSNAARKEKFKRIFARVLTRPALHAASLTFEHPSKLVPLQNASAALPERMGFVSPLPADIEEVVHILGGDLSTIELGLVTQ